MTQNAGDKSVAPLDLKRERKVGRRITVAYLVMMKKESAGLIMFRLRGGVMEILLAHPGGPFWKNKDVGAWSIPKGEIETGDDPLKTALREFEEEIGIKPQPPYLPLGSVKQKAGKIVHAWAFQGDIDSSKIHSNMVEIEWPPKSGKKIQFPEIDRAEFFNLRDAREKLNPAQVEFVTALEINHEK